MGSIQSSETEEDQRHETTVKPQTSSDQTNPSSGQSNQQQVSSASTENTTTDNHSPAGLVDSKASIDTTNATKECLYSAIQHTDDVLSLSPSSSSCSICSEECTFRYSLTAKGWDLNSHNVSGESPIVGRHTTDMPMAHLDSKIDKENCDSNQELLNSKFTVPQSKMDSYDDNKYPTVESNGDNRHKSNHASRQPGVDLPIKNRKASRPLLIKNQNGSQSLNLGNSGLKSYVNVQLQSFQKRLDLWAKEAEKEHHRPAGWYTPLIGRHLEEFRLTVQCLLVYETHNDPNLPGLLEMESFLVKYHHQRFRDEIANY